jgi:hypothetical protein
MPIIRKIVTALLATPAGTKEQGDDKHEGIKTKTDAPVPIPKEEIEEQHKELPQEDVLVASSRSHAAYGDGSKSGPSFSVFRFVQQPRATRLH